MKNLDINAPSEHHWAYRKFIEKDYSNMRNNGMTAGLDGFTKVTGEPTKVNEDQVIKTYEELKKIIPEWFWEYYKPGIGNPIGVERERTLLLSDMHCLLNAWVLYDYGIEHKRVLDIGGGFGCLAGMLMEVWDSQFYMMDLKDSLKLQRYYLGELHPDREVEYLTPGELPEVDLVINTRSFMEMTNDQIKFYLDEINKKSEYLYTVNRYQKGPAILKNYPFGDNWQILLSAPLRTQNYIHEFYLKKGGERFNKMLEILPPWRT